MTRRAWTLSTLASAAPTRDPTPRTTCQLGLTSTSRHPVVRRSRIRPQTFWGIPSSECRSAGPTQKGQRLGLSHACLNLGCGRRRRGRLIVTCPIGNGPFRFGRNMEMWCIGDRRVKPAWSGAAYGRRTDGFEDPPATRDHAHPAVGARWAGPRRCRRSATVGVQRPTPSGPATGGKVTADATWWALELWKCSQLQPGGRFRERSARQRN